jgi:hypothetical protein
VYSNCHILKYKRRNSLSGTGVLCHILKYKRSNSLSGTDVLLTVTY